MDHPAPTDEYYSPIIMNLQYFLASLCDMELQESEDQLGIRYPKTPEVSCLLTKIRESRLSANDILDVHPNAILSVLKEIVVIISPIFTYEEFVCISEDMSEDLFAVYLKSLMECLNYEQLLNLQLICQSLSKLIELPRSKTTSLTDVLITFTPLLFPQCRTSQTFLRAIRAVLVMIEKPDVAFGEHYIERGDFEYLLDLIASMEDAEDSGNETSSTPDETEEEITHTDLQDCTPFYVITYDV